MIRDRITQLAALLVALAALLGSAVLAPWIGEQRRELNLVYDAVEGEEVPWDIALLTTAAGSFRGIVVDALWYRAEMLKREGKHFEASSLADWITKLQPRFPQVWVFNGWNLAFNVSVQTHTPTERWDWVSKGERLLREQGVVYNPMAVPVYDMLSWIWQFKIGGTTDDMHWFYKLQVAQEWQRLMGPMPEGQDLQTTLAAFAPIRDAADRYFLFNRPSRVLRDELEKLRAAGLDDADVDAMLEMHVDALVERLTEMNRRADQPRAAREAIAPILTLALEAQERSRRDPLTVLYEDHPQTREVVEALREIGAGVDEQTTLRMGRLEGYLRYGLFRSVEDIVAWAQQNLSIEDQRLLKVMITADYEPGWRHLAPFMRARTMTADYKMDPGRMYRMMERYGPLDWRHPNSHSLYWAALGVERGGELADRTKVDMLNTYRRTIHSLQGLTYNGRVNYDPLLERISYQPDPRFIDSYIAAVEGATEWVDNPDDDVEFGSGVIRSFRSGHENFLQYATLISFLYGDRGQAQRYYEDLQEQYGQERTGQNRLGKYNLAMDDFIADMLTSEAEGQANTLAIIDALLTQAIVDGLEKRRLGVFDRMVGIAKNTHDRHNQLRGYDNPTGTEQRLTMKPFPQMMVDALARYFANARTDIYVRSETYRYLMFVPQLRGLAVRAYSQFYPDIVGQVEASLAQEAQQGAAEDIASRLFPRPPELEQAPEVEQTPDTPAPTVEKQ